MDEGRIKGSVFEKFGHLVARRVSPACVHGDQIGHGSAVDRNSQALTCFDLTEYLTNPVAQLPLRNRSHTYVVAYLLRARARPGIEESAKTGGMAGHRRGSCISSY